MKKIYIILTIFGVFAIDQISKLLILLTSLTYIPYNHILPNDPIFISQINRFFNVILTFNYGMSFSLLSFTSKWFFVTLISFICIIIIMWLLKEKSRLKILSYCFILGGAFGNLYDRIAYGAVVDFIDIHYGLYHWPTFNLADSFICLGAFIYLVSVIKKPKEVSKKIKKVK